MRSAAQIATQAPPKPAPVSFVGRLATYRYYNMDQVVGQALTAFKRLQLRLVERTPRRLDVAA